MSRPTRLTDAFKPVKAGLTVLKNAPVWSLTTTAATVGYAVGLREIASIVALGTTATASTAAKRSMTTTADTLASGQSASTLMIVLHVWLVVGLVFVLVLANFTMAAAERKARGHPSTSWWDWRNPCRSCSRCFAACWRVPSRLIGAFRALSLKGVVVPLVAVLAMDARLRGPIRMLRTAGRWTAVRFLLFALQLILAILFLRQVVSFVYLVATGSTTSYSTLQDVAATESALASTASSTTIGEAFIALNLAMCFAIAAVVVGWHALLHPTAKRRKPSKGKGADKDGQADRGGEDEQDGCGDRMLRKVCCSVRLTKRVKYGLLAVFVLALVVLCAAVVYSKQSSSSSAAAATTSS